MSAIEQARRLHALYEKPAHVEQALAILETLDDLEVKRFFVALLGTSAQLGERWRGSDLSLRALIECSPVLDEIANDLRRVQLSNTQLAMPGLGPVLRFTEDLVVHPEMRGGLLPDLVELPPLPRARTIMLTEVRVRLSALAQSPELTSLALFDGHAEDVALALHPDAPLQVLRLDRARRLTTLAGLETRRELEYVAIVGARPSDLTPLTSSSTLRKLDLRHCTLPSLEPLASLRELRVLALAETGKTPSDVPEPVRCYATWTPKPQIELLAERPVHPDVV